MLLAFWLLSEEAGEVPCLAPESLLLLWPGVSTLPLMAWSLAAAFRAEHLLPRTSGWGGVELTLLGCGLLSAVGWDPKDFRVTRVDVSLPDSPPVEVVLLDRVLSVLLAGFLLEIGRASCRERV